MSWKYVLKGLSWICGGQRGIRTPGSVTCGRVPGALISHFEDIQKIVKRRTAIVEIFQCLLCYLLMSDYGITKYTKAVNAMNYLMMRLYNEDDQFSLTTLNKVLINSESTIAERRKLTKTIKETLSLEKIKP